MNPQAATPAPQSAPSAPAVDATDPAAMGNAFVQDQMAGRKAGAARSGAPKSKDDAKKRNAADLTAVARLLEAGKAIDVDPSAGLDSRPNMFHNSAEWVASGNVDTYVLSRVHDEHKRPSVGEGTAAYFDTRVKTTFSGGTATAAGTPDYDATVDGSGSATNDTGVLVEPNTTLAMLDGSDLVFLSPSRQNEGELVETLIHEIQHDADQHDSGRTGWTTTGGGTDPSSLTIAPAEAWTTYQSEVRAYWLQSPEGQSGNDYLGVKDEYEQMTLDTVDPATGNTLTVTTGLKNARVMSIFMQMVGRSDGVFLDPDTKAFNGPYGWVGHYYVVDKAFRKMVNAFDVPTAGNAINSVRIQALSDALAGGAWATIEAAAQALDPLDRTYLQDRRASGQLWAQAKAALTADDLAKFEDTVGPMMGPWQSARLTTQKGDTLWKLAERFFEDGEAWVDFKTANPDVKLPKKAKDALTPGLVLVIPKL